MLEDKLNHLRKLYVKASDEEKKRIAAAGKDLKNGVRFGGKDKGGNGLCYECYVNDVELDEWNCETCKGPRKAIRGQKYTLEEAREILLKRGDVIKEEKTSDQMSLKEIKEIFA